VFPGDPCREVIIGKIDWTVVQFISVVNFVKKLPSRMAYRDSI
jgi:hypothetical protein